MMKKAYVKPVFFAEEFVAAASYAVGACGLASINEPLSIKDGDCVCTKCNDSAGKGQAVVDEFWQYTDAAGNLVTSHLTYWEYAGGPNGSTNGESKLFGSNTVECDFVWAPTSDQDTKTTVKVWNTTDLGERLLKGLTDTGKIFSLFFYGNASTQGEHYPAYKSEAFFS